MYISRKSWNLLVSGLLTFVASCGLLLDPHGSKKYISISVLVETEGGRPLYKYPVHVLETFGNTHYLTAETNTDETGVVMIIGERCLPLTIAVDGGEITINTLSNLNSFVVKVPEHWQRSFRENYGEIAVERNSFISMHRKQCD
jgi:hypothetical protein